MFGLRREAGAVRGTPRTERVRSFVVLAAAGFGLALAGCGEESLGPVCTAEAVFGINLTVRDGAGAPAAQGATGMAVDGSFHDTLLVLGDVQMAGAVERAGTYDITVSKAGHATWSATGVTVTADECHVHPVRFDVNLIAVP